MAKEAVNCPFITKQSCRERKTEILFRNFYFFGRTTYRRPSSLLGNVVAYG